MYKNDNVPSKNISTHYVASDSTRMRKKSECNSRNILDQMYFQEILNLERHERMLTVFKTEVDITSYSYKLLAASQGSKGNMLQKTLIQRGFFKKSTFLLIFIFLSKMLHRNIQTSYFKPNNYYLPYSSNQITTSQIRTWRS